MNHEIKSRREHWSCHTWGNCPLSAAFGAKSIANVPVLLRPEKEEV